jgi:glycosyltransferase involved in cell wall biosynthesis
MRANSAQHARHIMFGTIAWKVTSRLAIAASWLPRPVYLRLLSYILQPLLRSTRGQAPALQEPRPGGAPAGPVPQRADRAAAQSTAGEKSAPAPAALSGRTVARALVIDGFTPTPDKDAASNDVYWFMRILRSLDYEVTFVAAFATAYAGRYTDDLLALGIICPVAPALGSARDFVALHGGAFDLIALYRITVAEGLIEVLRRSAPNAKVIFNPVDLHFLRDQRQAELTGNLHAFVDAKRREPRELRVVRAVDAAVLLSDFEYDYVGRHAPDARRVFIPLATPVPGRLAPYEERAGVLFVGGFAHAPNVDAVHFLCGAIWPCVRRLVPDARLFVAGADPPDEIAAYQAPSEGIEIMGHVADLTDLYRTVRVAVAPLRFGAGLKGKVVSSLAVGLPCVATSIAREGMPEGGTDAVVVADEAGDFARAIADIHANPVRWYRMSDQGVAYAHANFSIEAIAGKVRELLASLGLPHDGTPHSYN